MNMMMRMVILLSNLPSATQYRIPFPSVTTTCQLAVETGKHWRNENRLHTLPVPGFPADCRDQMSDSTRLA